MVDVRNSQIKAQLDVQEHHKRHNIWHVIWEKSYKQKEIENFIK